MDVGGWAVGIRDHSSYQDRIWGRILSPSKEKYDRAGLASVWY